MIQSNPGMAMPSDDTRTFYSYSSPKGGAYQFKVTPQAAIVLVEQGAVAVVMNGYRRSIVHNGEMFLLPPNMRHHIVSQDDNTRYTLCFFNPKALHGEGFASRSLQVHNYEPGGAVFTLGIHPLVSSFLRLLENYMHGGILDDGMQQIKLRELFYLLRSVYQTDTVGRFFAPVISDDMEFMDFVASNYVAAKTVGDLAGRSRYSLPGFTQRFKRVYGKTPSAWMAEQKKEELIKDLINSTMLVRDIADKHGFSSYIKMYGFCKKHLGAAPREIRQRHKDIKK